VDTMDCSACMDYSTSMDYLACMDFISGLFVWTLWTMNYAYDILFLGGYVGGIWLNTCLNQIVMYYYYHSGCS
jgi:hypothetical protein